MLTTRSFPSAIALVVAGLFVFPLAACQSSVNEIDDNWPPVSGELHQVFRNNQQGLEMLSKELAGSEYFSVILWGDGAVRASKHGSEGIEKVEMEDPRAWKALFDEAGVDTATKYMDEVSLHKRFDTAGTFGKTVYDYLFVRSAEPDTLICIPRYSESECGTCDEQLDDTWYLRLLWYPSDWLSEFEGLDVADTEQFDELISNMQPKMSACLDRFFDEQQQLRDAH